MDQLPLSAFLQIAVLSWKCFIYEHIEKKKKKDFEYLYSDL